MPAPGKPQGVQSGLSAAEQQLESFFNTLSKKTDKYTKAQGKRLLKLLDKMDKETKTYNDVNSLLVNTLRKVTRGTKEFEKGAVVTANKVAEGSELMTTAQEEAHETQIKLIEEQISALKSAGGHQKEIALLDEQRNKMEVANFESKVKTEGQLAMLQVRGGQVMRGTWGGVMSNFQLRGSRMSRKMGQMFGLSSKTMGTVAKALGALITAGLAFMTMSQLFSKSAIEAAEAGYELGDSAVDSGMQVERAARDAFSILNVGAKGLSVPFASASERAELLAAASKEYAFGLTSVGDAYFTSIKATAAARTSQRISTVQNIADMAKLAQVLGLNRTEAVKLGTRLGVLAKTDGPQAVQTLFVLGSEAQRLGQPIGDLVTIFEGLAQVADLTGESAANLTAQTLSIDQAFRNMGNKGLKVLQNVDDAKIARMSKQFAGMITGMDTTRLAALIAKPNQSLNSIIDQVEDMSPGDRANAIKANMRRYGISSGGKITGEQGLFITRALFGAGTGDLRSDAIAGREAAAALSGGALGGDVIKNLKQRQADLLDQKFDQAKSVGGNLAAGADVFQVIAGTLNNLLRVVVEAINKAKIFGSETARDLETKFAKADAAKKEYERQAQAGRVNRGIPARRAGAM